MNQKDTVDSETPKNINEIKKGIASQIDALEELYKSTSKFLELPPLVEAELLEEICNKARFTYPKSASHTEKIETEAYSCILKILQIKNLGDIRVNTKKLEELKAEDRQNMPYQSAHIAGISAAAIIGFPFLIAAAIVFGLIGLPAGLVFFLPLLIIGVIGLVSSIGLIKKGMIDNDRLLAEAWESDNNEGIDKEFSMDTFSKSIMSVAGVALVNANNEYLLPENTRNPREHSQSNLFQGDSHNKSPYRRPPSQAPHVNFIKLNLGSYSNSPPPVHREHSQSNLPRGDSRNSPL